MAAEDFVMDQDPVIPTGIPATAEQVAEMVVSPDSPVSESVVESLVEWQRPTEEQIVAAEDRLAEG